MTLSDDAVISASEGFAVERGYVVAGLIDCVALHDAAVDHELCGADFSDPTCGRLFEILCAFAKTGWRTNPAEVRRYCSDQGLPIAEQNWSDLLGESLNADTGEILQLAAQVAGWRDRCRRATELVNQARSVMWCEVPVSRSRRIRTGPETYERRRPRA